MIRSVVACLAAARPALLVARRRRPPPADLPVLDLAHARRCRPTRPTRTPRPSRSASSSARTPTASSPACASTRAPATPAPTSATCGARPARNLGTVTFTGETASGWQTGHVRHPGRDQRPTRPTSSRTTRRTAGTPATTAYFAAAGVDNAPLHALRGRGRRRQRRLPVRHRRRLPDQHLAVGELLGRRGVQHHGADTTPPTVTGTAPAAGATGVRPPPRSAPR